MINTFFGREKFRPNKLYVAPLKFIKYKYFKTNRNHQLSFPIKNIRSRIVVQIVIARHFHLLSNEYNYNGN